MSTFDLYGIKEVDIDAAKTLIEQFFDGRFVAHDSSYIGEYWLLSYPSGGKVSLQPNLTPVEEDDWAEEDYKEYPNLLYISNLDAQDEILKQLQVVDGVVHLRREVR
jgi:hypothetical protein